MAGKRTAPEGVHKLKAHATATSIRHGEADSFAVVDLIAGDLAAGNLAGCSHALYRRLPKREVNAWGS